MNHRCLGFTLVMAAYGCGGSASTPTTGTSVASGTLALSTFPAAPTAVVATASDGSVRATPSGSGAFSLPLKNGVDYTLDVEAGGHRVPLGLPRKSGKIERSFHTASTGGTVDLGAVRYRAAGGKDAPSANDPADGCEEKSGDDSAKGAKGAAAGSNEDGGADPTDGTEVADPSGTDQGDQADGECENGVDAKTGAACTDAPESGGGLKGSDEMCVPDNDPPSGSCASGGETEVED